MSATVRVGGVRRDPPTKTAQKCMSDAQAFLAKAASVRYSTDQRTMFATLVLANLEMAKALSVETP